MVATLRKVIIIDDDEAVLDSLEALLLAEGFAVEASPARADFSKVIRMPSAVVW
jgi:FixJ family two-component response regulator